MKRWRTAVGVVTAMITWTAATATAASGAAPRLHCGQIVTRDTTLHHDVGPCPGDGIVVAANGVTLNLRGHHVFGAAGPGDGTAAGIRLAGTTGVTVVGGKPGATVSGFDAGVAIYGGSGNVVKHLTVRDNVGPPLEAEPELGDGIVLFQSARNHISRNTVLRNGIYDGIGVLDLQSDDNVIERNTVEGSTGAGATAIFTGIGIIVNPIGLAMTEQPISGNRIVGNLVRNNERAGISNISNIDGVISKNTVEGNQGLAGIGVSRVQDAQLPTRVLIEGNTVRSNTGDGIQVINAQQNRVLENVVLDHRDPTMGRGIFVGGQRATHNEVRGNESHQNEAGIWVSAFSWYNHILENNAAFNVFHDLVDTNAVDISGDPDCFNNVWFANTYSGEVFPPCTATGGTDLTPDGESAVDSSTLKTSTAAPPEPDRLDDPHLVPEGTPSAGVRSGLRGGESRHAADV